MTSYSISTHLEQKVIQTVTTPCEYHFSHSIERYKGRSTVELLRAPTIWDKNLPPHLKLAQQSDENVTFSRKAKVLRSR